MHRTLTALGLTILLAGFALAEETKDTTKSQPATADNKKAETADMKDTTAADVVNVAAWTTTKSGLKWRDKVVGTGTEAKMQMPVKCHYTLWLSDSTGTKGKLVQSSKGNQPYQCTIGVRLIQGWSEGMVGMKEGGTRELIIAPHIGYGSQAMGDMIPANSTLYFEIEFLNEVRQ